MRPSELLHKVKRNLLAGPARDTWRRGDLRPGPYVPCVMERVGQTPCGISLTSAPGHVIHMLAVNACNDAAREMGALSATPSVWLNDRGPTGLWGVVAMLGRAIRRLEAEGR